MQKLIERCKANPSTINLARLQAYMDKHPMAVCMTTKEERDLLTSWNIRV